MSKVNPSKLQACSLIPRDGDIHVLLRIYMSGQLLRLVPVSLCYLLDELTMHSLALWATKAVIC